MASAASPKRMVSSIFITLASPCKATLTQQQHACQTHHTGTRDNQHPVACLSPTNSVPSIRRKSEGRPPSESVGVLPRDGANNLQNSKPSYTALNSGQPQKDAKELSSPPPLLSPLLPSPLGKDSAPLPPTAPELLSPSPSTQETSTPSIGSDQDQQPLETHHVEDQSEERRDICGFCRKAVALTEPAIEALNRTYHDSCFQCRSCHVPLAGKQYYNKSGIPLCEDCYQASLELCWKCGEVITQHVIRALERAYHPSCFTCATCNQEIGEQRFAQGEVGEVYCLQDYYRKYAPQCDACSSLIIPQNDGTDSYTVECLGRTYHEDCYRCEVCAIQLSPEPNDHGCYPLDGKMLCKSCHLSLVSGHL